MLVHTVRQRPLVAACCERARAAGVRPGMTVADARALIRSDAVRIEQHNPQRDGASLDSLARWATRFTPSVAPDPPDGLLLNVTGCLRLFRGERRMLRLVASGVERLGLACRVALAPTYGAAWALARYSESQLAHVEAAALSEALSPLPVRALRLEDGLVAALDEVGIARVGDLLALPRSTLPVRFGADLLLRLDQAFGLTGERIEPVRPREPLGVERALDGPTTNLEGLGMVVRGLLEDLSAELARRCSGVRRLDATFDRTDVGPLILTVTLGRASREAKHLWRLLWPHMERMPMGFGVDRVEVRATRCAALRDMQQSRWGAEDEGDADAGAISVLGDTISNRIGPDRVCRAVLVDTHIPERGFEYVPLVASADRRSMPRGQEEEGVGVALRDRPSLLLARPEAVMVAANPDAAPASVTWRGRECGVVASVGPERIAGAWWEAGDTGGDGVSSCNSARDYFKVQDRAGRWLWVYRETRTGRWFAHGLWA